MEAEIEPLILPELPRSMTGLNKDGTRDKRRKSGLAYTEYLIEQMAGISEYTK